MPIALGRLRSIIREEATRLLREGDSAPVLYTGIVLDPGVTDRLRNMISKLGYDGDVESWELSNIAEHGNEQLNHHMTITVGALKPSDPLRDMLGEDADLRVVGWGVDPKTGVAAWKVEPPSDVPVKTGNPHITAALENSGVKPFLASKIKDWRDLDKPFTVTGTILEIRPKD
jgi:hypothetical protein